MRDRIQALLQRTNYWALTVIVLQVAIIGMLGFHHMEAEADPAPFSYMDAESDTLAAIERTESEARDAKDSANEAAEAARQAKDAADRARSEMSSLSLRCY